MSFLLLTVTLAGCAPFMRKEEPPPPAEPAGPVALPPLATHTFPYDPHTVGVVGELQVTVARHEDTFADLARRFNLGFDEIALANPGVDPLGKPWTQVRESVTVKLLEQPEELYVLARSQDRVQKERAMRRRRLKRLLARLRELQTQQLTRDQLLMKIGAAKKEAGRTYALVAITLPQPEEPVNAQTFSFRLNCKKLRVAAGAKVSTCCARI